MKVINRCFRLGAPLAMIALLAATLLGCFEGASERDYEVLPVAGHSASLDDGILLKLALSLPAGVDIIALRFYVDGNILEESAEGWLRHIDSTTANGGGRLISRFSDGVLYFSSPNAIELHPSELRELEVRFNTENDSVPLTASDRYLFKIPVSINRPPAATATIDRLGIRSISPPESSYSPMVLRNTNNDILLKIDTPDSLPADTIIAIVELSAVDSDGDMLAIATNGFTSATMVHDEIRDGQIYLSLNTSLTLNATAASDTPADNQRLGAIHRITDGLDETDINNPIDFYLIED